MYFDFYSSTSTIYAYIDLERLGLDLFSTFLHFYIFTFLCFSIFTFLHFYISGQLRLNYVPSTVDAATATNTGANAAYMPFKTKQLRLNALSLLLY